jgi:hypothetical protein
MRFLLLLLAVLLPTTANEAQARREFPAQIAKNPRTPKITSIEILEKGVFKAQARDPLQNRNSPGGVVRPLDSISLVESTTTIPSKQGMHFGIRYIVHGFPRGARVPIKVVQHYPKAGLHNPRTKKTTLTYQQTSLKMIGYPNFDGYHLENAWELVPGIWTIEIWYDGHKLAEQKFELTAK